MATQLQPTTRADTSCDNPRMPRKRHHRRRRLPEAADPDRRFLTTEQLVDASGLTREQLWRGRSASAGLASGVHYVRVGRRLLWHRENVRDWLRRLGLSTPWARDAAEALERQRLTDTDPP
ncbi:MAG: hypothetical protein AAF184_01295 [Pseudomonadota bacterium]